MKLIPNANPNLVLVQVEASYFEGTYEMEMGLEVPIKHFAGDVPVGVIDLMPPEHTTKGAGLEVFECCFRDLVLKDRETGSFFPADRVRGWLERPQQGWANEDELKDAGRRTLDGLIADQLLKQRGEENRFVPSTSFYGMTREFEVIRDLYARQGWDTIEWAALCWLLGSESDACDEDDEDTHVAPLDVLQYLKERGFKAMPPRLLEAVRGQKAA